MTFFQKLFIVSIKLLCKLPWRILYFISDFIALVLYFIVRYRKKVVYENLNNSFPDKTKQEIKKIARQYYRHIADIMIETFCVEKIMSNLKGHIDFKDRVLLNRLYNTGKSIMFVGGHMGNWEWVGFSTQNLGPFKAKGIVKPLSSPFFDQYIEGMRNKYSSGIIPFKQTLRAMIKSKDEQILYMLAIDQTPHRDEIHFWVDFLNQPTPVFQGTEKIARALDMPVVFFDCYRIKRGRYEMKLTLLSETPKQTKEGEITIQQFKLLEEAIKERPYNWLWSHRRWKYKDEYPKYLEQLANTNQ